MRQKMTGGDKIHVKIRCFAIYLFSIISTTQTSKL